MELFAGLDVHSQFTVGTVVDVKGHIVHEGKVPTTSDGYRTFFEPIRFQNQIKAVFEASRNWSYIAGLLRAQNVETVMAHPLKVRSIACAKIKTDKIDSQKLAHLLRADMIPMSYMPSQDIVQLRELVRYRVRLGKMRSQLKTQIRTVLAREGKTCPFTDVSGSKASIFLKKQGLLPQNQRELNYLLSLLTNMTEEIDSLQKGIHEEAIKHPEVQLITSIPGFADYSGLLILSEIGDINRFDSPEKLAAYAGLVSSTHQSSDTCRQGKDHQTRKQMASMDTGRMHDNHNQKTKPTATILHAIKSQERAQQSNRCNSP